MQYVVLHPDPPTALGPHGTNMLGPWARPPARSMARIVSAPQVRLYPITRTDFGPIQPPTSGCACQRRQIADQRRPVFYLTMRSPKQHSRAVERSDEAGGN